MRLEQLQLVSEIAKCNSISKASEKLYISRQNASHSLIQLEKEFGAKLFERNSNGVILTEEGEIVSYYANKILKECSALRLDLTERLLLKYKEYHGDVCMYFSQVYVHLMTKIIDEIYSFLPNANFKVYSLDYDFQFRPNQEENTGAIIYFSAAFRNEWDNLSKNSELRIARLSTVHLNLCCSKAKVANFNQSVTKEELEHLPMACYSSSNNGLNTNFFNYLKLSQSMNLNVSFSSNNTSAIAERVAAGSHYAIALEYADQIDKSQTTLIPIKNLEPLIFFVAYNAVNLSSEVQGLFPVLVRHISNII